MTTYVIFKDNIRMDLNDDYFAGKVNFWINDDQEEEVVVDDNDEGGNEWRTRKNEELAVKKPRYNACEEFAAFYDEASLETWLSGVENATRTRFNG
jgi:hypothetical protein